MLIRQNLPFLPQRIKVLNADKKRISESEGKVIKLELIIEQLMEKIEDLLTGKISKIFMMHRLMNRIEF